MTILNPTMNDRQFRNYVRTLITEDDGGGDAGGIGGSGFGYGDMYGGGMGGMYIMGSNQGLYDTFVKPFLEVIQTTSGVTKEFMRRVGTAVNVAFEVVVTTMIPFVRDSYAEIFDDEERDIEALRMKYKEIYASNEEMFYNADMHVLAFSINPVRYATAIFLRKSPKAASKALEILTGDNSNVKYWFKRARMLYDFTGSDREWQKREWEFNLQRRRFDDNASRAATRRQKGETVEPRPVITEDVSKGKSDQSWKKEAYKKLVSEMASDPEFISAVENSPKARAMHEDAVKVIKKFHAAVKQEADSVNHINDMNSLKSFVKATKSSKAINALEQFEAAIKKEQTQSGDVKNEAEGTQNPAVAQSIVPKFVTEVKKAIKGIFGSGIDSQIKAAKEAGMSDDTEIVQLLVQAKRDVTSL